MIKDFIDKWHERKHLAKEWFVAKMENHKFAFYHGPLYKDVVQMLVTEVLRFDKSEIAEFATSSYSGDKLYIICKYSEHYGRQVDEIYHTHNYYGSCYGCDTLERCFYDYGEEGKKELAINDFMTLCLHLIQRMKQFDFDYTDEEMKDEMV